MKTILLSVLITTLLGFYGCSPASSEEAAAEARVDATEARTDAANANARVEAADAYVRAADARVRAADADVDASNAEARVQTKTTPAAKAPAAAAKEKRRIPSGTVFQVSLIDGLSTETSSAGDRFMASLAEAVIVDGRTLLPKGTKVRGQVLGVEESGRVKGTASIRLALTDIAQGNRMIPITTDTLSATADSTTKRDAGIIAGAAGIGAAIGAIAGGKKGAGIGAISGGGAGTGVVLATKGEGIHYPSETRMHFVLADSVQL